LRGRDEFIRGLFGLEGRVALVTGARQGIGRAIAEALAYAGADVALTARDPSTIAPLVARIGNLGVKVVALECELSDPAGIESAISQVVERLGRLDIVINNAGLSIHGPALSFNLDDWDRIFDANLRGAFVVSRTAARFMRDKSGGRIVNLSSPFAQVGVVDRVAYSSSKAGLEQLTRSLAVEWAPFGITVNAVAPTTVLTETRVNLFKDEEALRRRIAEIPLGRLADANDVQGAVLFLCGRAGSFVTGVTLHVDGGYTVKRS
jgi:NAD(P)-dependent dehydrogenase (short-subunit alcohol dehydrogenase family)